MSYRLIDSNAIAIKYPEVNEMPCVFANLPDGMNGQFIDVQPEVLACGNGELIAKLEPQWIPVEREFPEDYTDVLVWFEYFRYGDYNCLYQTHGIGTYVANYNSWTINHESGWKDLRVIAWMPLPKPFEGGIK